MIYYRYYKNNLQQTIKWSFVSYTNYIIRKIFPFALILIILCCFVDKNVLDELLNNINSNNDINSLLIELKNKLLIIFTKTNIINNIIDTVNNHKYIFILLILLTYVYYRFMLYTKKVYKQYRMDFIEQIHDNMLKNFQIKYVHMRLDMGTKPSRKKFINQFLHYYGLLNEIKYVFNLLPKLLFCAIFIMMLKIYLLFFVLTILLMAIFYLLPNNSSSVSYKHIDNYNILYVNKSYYKHIKISDKYGFFVKSSLISFCNVLLNMLIYLTILLYIINNKKLDTYILCFSTIFCLLQPVPTINEINNLNNIINMFQYHIKQYEGLPKIYDNPIHKIETQYAQQLIEIPNGLTVIAGKSGSGKTTLLAKILGITGENKINNHINKLPITNHITLLSKKFFCPLSLKDIFSLHVKNCTDNKIIQLIHRCNLSYDLFKLPNSLNHIIPLDDYKWHLCAALGSDKDILVCDDVNILPWLDILKKYFKKIIMTCDDSKNEYENKAELYIKL